MNKNQFQQGDVCYERIDKLPEGVTPVKRTHEKGHILAAGEATGHHHTITVPKIDDMDAIRTADGGWLLTLRAEGTLVHQEHKPIVVPIGTYRIGHEREKDWFSLAVRKVVD